MSDTFNNIFGEPLFSMNGRLLPYPASKTAKKEKAKEELKKAYRKPQIGGPRGMRKKKSESSKEPKVNNFKDDPLMAKEITVGPARMGEIHAKENEDEITFENIFGEPLLAKNGRLLPNPASKVTYFNNKEQLKKAQKAPQICPKVTRKRKNSSKEQKVNNDDQLMKKGSIIHGKENNKAKRNQPTKTDEARMKRRVRKRLISLFGSDLSDEEDTHFRTKDDEARMKRRIRKRLVSLFGSDLSDEEDMDWPAKRPRLLAPQE